MLHFIDAKFRGTAESVLDASQNAVHVMLVTLKLDNGVNDMFQNFWSGQRAFFGDMTNEQHGYSAGFGEAQQGGSTLADLCYRTCRRLNVLSRDGLYGVDDDQFGLNLLDVVEDGFQRVLTENEEVVVLLMGDALCTHLQLVSTFLTADVEHALVGQLEHGLQTQSRLADTWFTAQQHDAARHQSTAQHTVQLGVVHVDAGVVVGGNLFQFQHLVLAQLTTSRCGC